MAINYIDTKKSTHLYTKGGGYSLNAEEYIGEYHFRGLEAWTGPTHTNESKKLSLYHPSVGVMRYNVLRPENERILTYREPTYGLVYPNDINYSQGVFTRFFVRKLDKSNLIIEIDSEQAKQYGVETGIDPVLYQLETIQWRITTVLANLKSIELENAKTIAIANKKMPGLSDYIYSYSEFSEITI